MSSCSRSSHIGKVGIEGNEMADKLAYDACIPNGHDTLAGGLEFERMSTGRTLLVGRFITPWEGLQQLSWQVQMACSSPDVQHAAVLTLATPRRSAHVMTPRIVLGGVALKYQRKKQKRFSS